MSATGAHHSVYKGNERNNNERAFENEFRVTTHRFVYRLLL